MKFILTILILLSSINLFAQVGTGLVIKASDIEARPTQTLIEDNSPVNQPILEGDPAQLVTNPNTTNSSDSWIKMNIIGNTATITFKLVSSVNNNYQMRVEGWIPEQYRPHSGIGYNVLASTGQDTFMIVSVDTAGSIQCSQRKVHYNSDTIQVANLTIGLVCTGSISYVFNR